MSINDERIVVLHISDVHAGSYLYRNGEYIGNRQLDADSNTEKISHDASLDALIKHISKLKTDSPDWTPTAICFTGDAAFAGKKRDYGLFETWFIDLCRSLDVSPEYIIMCPGNHDADRDLQRGLESVNEAAQAEKNCIDLPHEQSIPFRQYQSFCKRFKIVPLAYRGPKQYMFGCRKIGFVNFYVTNTSYNYINDNRYYKNRESIWLGKGAIKGMIADGQIVEAAELKDEINVLLAHHPRDWLRVEERFPKTGDLLTELTIDIVRRYFHLYLSGHTHDYRCDADLVHETCWQLSVGSIIGRGSNVNSYALYRLHRGKDSVERRVFVLDATASPQTFIEHVKNDLPLLGVTKNKDREDQV